MRLAVAALMLASVARGFPARDRGAEGAALQANAPTGIDRTQLVDNATVTVTRLHFAPGAAEERHTHAFPLLIVQLTDGAMTVKQGDLVKVSDRAGEVFFVPAEAPHAASTNARKAMDLIAVAIKPARPRAPAAPATTAPMGVTRTTILDNDVVRVVLVKFAPDGREPMHTHPNDLLTIQMSAGLVEIVNGSNKSTSVRQPGFVQFVPRDVSHAYASADTKPFELISVAIK
jgi:quercetin dioxygenase-like cupin family protein